VSADEITVNIGLNGDCYIADKYKERDFVSDDSLTESTDDEEYDTDLEVNEGRSNYKTLPLRVAQITKHYHCIPKRVAQITKHYHFISKRVVQITQYYYCMLFLNNILSFSIIHFSFSKLTLRVGIAIW
jgi:hypothetical protein